jgi:hypothetical protein
VLLHHSGGFNTAAAKADRQLQLLPATLLLLLLPVGTAGTSFASWLHKGLLCQVNGPAHCCCLVDCLLIFTLWNTVSNKTRSSLQNNNSSSSVLIMPRASMSGSNLLPADAGPVLLVRQKKLVSTAANTTPHARISSPESALPVASTPKAVWPDVNAL